MDQGLPQQEGGRGQRSGRISSRTMSKGQDVHVNWHALFGMHVMVHAGPRICAALLLRRLRVPPPVDSCAITARTHALAHGPTRPTDRPPRAHTTNTQHTQYTRSRKPLSLTHTHTDCSSAWTQAS